MSDSTDQQTDDALSVEQLDANVGPISPAVARQVLVNGWANGSEAGDNEVEALEEIASWQGKIEPGDTDKDLPEGFPVTLACEVFEHLDRDDAQAVEWERHSDGAWHVYFPAVDRGAVTRDGLVSQWTDARSLDDLASRYRNGRMSP